VNLTDPGPVIDVAPTGATNPALLDAVQAQPAFVVTEIVNSPPVNVTGVEGPSLTLNEQVELVPPGAGVGVVGASLPHATPAALTAKSKTHWRMRDRFTGTRIISTRRGTEKGRFSSFWRRGFRLGHQSDVNKAAAYAYSIHGHVD
jgi:hypothetical protein